MEIVAKTGSDAFVGLLQHFDGLPPNSSPRGHLCREELNATVVVERPSDTAFVTASAKRNERMAKYLEAEFRLYESGEDRLEEFVKHAKFWSGVTDGDRVNSAYGKIVFFDRLLSSGETPWDWAKRALQEDPDTRQAIVQYLQPRHYQQPVKDFVCTCHGAFHLRDGTLRYTVVMRSNDVVRGFAYDVPWQMRCQLRMATELGVAVGRYTHFVHSLHVYERDMDLVKEMLGGAQLAKL